MKKKVKNYETSRLSQKKVKKYELGWLCQKIEIKRTKKSWMARVFAGIFRDPPPQNRSTPPHKRVLPPSQTTLGPSPPQTPKKTPKNFSRASRAGLGSERRFRSFLCAFNVCDRFAAYTTALSLLLQPRDLFYCMATHFECCKSHTCRHKWCVSRMYEHLNN